MKTPVSNAMCLFAVFGAIALPSPGIVSHVRRVEAPVDGAPRLVLSRAGLNSTDSTDYEVNCFDQLGPDVLARTIADDCNFVINEIIVRLPNPMQEQIWGYNDLVDVDLRLRNNRSWHYRQCVIALVSSDETEEDIFRPVDIAVVAKRILQRCVTSSKDALGGSSYIGAPWTDFHVLLGGVHTMPGLASGIPLSQPPSLAPDNSVSSKSSERISRTKPVKRLIHPYGQRGESSLIIPMSCVKPGTPAAAAGKLDQGKCVEAAKTLLHHPRILDLENFTTEPSGGVHVPFIYRADGCYLQVSTNTPLSSTVTLTMLRAVYYASEIMKRCPLGGVAKLGVGSGFFVSVTALDPMPGEIKLGSLLNSTSMGSGLGVQSL